MGKLMMLALATMSVLGLSSCQKETASRPLTTEDLGALPKETATLTFAPQVPPPIHRDGPARVQVRIETKEVTMRLADGVDYTFWTFGGHVPGPFIRVRQGDYVDFTLSNHPSSKMPHNIDLHSVIGQGGGAEATFTAPGHSSSFSFQALSAGLYVYHCATAPVGMHVANGMYGLILVEPPQGLPKVDREYYIMQSEFYTKGKYGAAGLQPFDMDKAVEEKPDYVVFNGSVGSLTGENALKGQVGEKIRLFVGNGGPNLVSSFHVIGEIFDDVYGEGGILVTQKNVQTTLIPAGGSTVVDFKLDSPGNFVLVDHSIFRAFNKGAMAVLKVPGEHAPAIYTGKTSEGLYQPDAETAPASTPAPATDNREKTLEQRIAAGKAVFTQNCMACHQAGGEGLPGAIPPLAKSDFLMADKRRAIGIVLKGRQGEILVNKMKFNGVMPNLNLSDEDAANVLSYVRNSWGNKGDLVTASETKKER